MDKLREIINKLIQELDTIVETNNKLIDVNVVSGINEYKDSLKEAKEAPLTNTSKTIKVPMSDEVKLVIASKGHNSVYVLLKQQLHSYQTIADTAVQLNKILDKPITRVSKIEEAQAKSIITVEEVELLYGYGKESQKGYRSRIKNPLPYLQKGHGAKIQYNKKVVEAWLES